jgi:hypothetical protein
MTEATQRVLLTLRHEVGVREDFVNGHFNNRGRKVEEYQNADTLPGVGYSWCVSLLAWAFLTSFGQLLCDQVWLRSASCDAILDWARRHRILNATPEAGCMGLVLASKNDAVHGFAVEEVLAKSIRTIEGNTNVDGSREGNGVYARRRALESRYQFIHWQKLLPTSLNLPTAPSIVPPKARRKSPLDGAPLLDLYFADKRADSVPLVAGRTWLPAHKWAHWMKAPLGWNIESQTVLIAGREVPSQPILIDGRAWLPVRALAEFLGLSAEQVGDRVVVSHS